MAARTGGYGADFECRSDDLLHRQKRQSGHRNNWLDQSCVGLRAGLEVSRRVKVEESNLSKHCSRVDYLFRDLVFFIFYRKWASTVRRSPPLVRSHISREANDHS